MNDVKSQDLIGELKVRSEMNNWKLHKLHSGYISFAYENVNPKKSERMKECAHWLSFWRKEDGSMKLHDARFCRVRLCPICQWRRSLKTFSQMKQILDIATADGYQFIFLTLTVKNCKGVKLSDELTHLLLSFNRLSKYKDVHRAVKGYYRGCEVTHNINTDEYHPHLHVILAVRSTYFNGKTYISHDKWIQLWKRALQVDYDPIVDVRRCYGGAKSIAEACKYTVKPSDILNFNDWDMTVETVRTLDAALENRRFVGLGGIIKDIHKSLHLDDPDDGDLVHLDADPADEPTQEEIIYFWNGYNQYERSV